MSQCEVVANIRDTAELQKIINGRLKDGWTLNSTYPVSGPGYIGVSYVAVFVRSAIYAPTEAGRLALSNTETK